MREADENINSPNSGLITVYKAFTYVDEFFKIFSVFVNSLIELMMEKPKKFFNCDVTV